ncbi:MAG: endonuclease/exonuclease/phosphatase family protein [Bacteroidales bacterium]
MLLCHKKHTFLLILLFLDFAVYSQTTVRSELSLRIMFFNLENYFSPFEDSLNLNKEFTAESSRHWTWSRFAKKTNQIFKTIVAVGGIMPPELIGICEVENRFVLNRLVYETPLSKYPYGIVHKESPDTRGIDVGLLYHKEKFQLIGQKFIHVSLPNKRKTRDILLAQGIINNLDTLYVIVCHLPSKYGGAAASEPSRMSAAKQLKGLVDSLLKTSNNAKLVMMGDFNDTPDSPCILDGLGVSNFLQGTAKDSLYNLALPHHNASKGTIKYQGKWELIDLIFVSGNLLNKDEAVYTTPSDYYIFSAPFLLEDDKNHFGYKPYRTYNGFKYNGGISDHLPVVLDIRKGF